MIAIASLLVGLLCDCFKPRQRIVAEILALRHQLTILQHRAPRRLNLRWVDRALLIWLYRRFPRIVDVVTIVRPETVVVGIAWDTRHFGNGNPVGAAAGHGLAKRCAT
jgi:hypothetical protein